MRSTVLAFLLLSARGGVAALAAWLVCRALRRAHAPSRLLCWLWLAVGLRFVLPWGIPLKLPRPESAPLAAAADTVQELGELPLLPPAPAAAAAAAPLPWYAQLTPWHALAAVWLVGVLVLAVRGAVGYLKLKRCVALACKTPDGCYSGACVPTPFTLGFVRPRVYLPDSLQGPARQAVLLHERTHIRRRDPLVKPLFYAVVCLHWFNPLAWLALCAFEHDMEAACDEAAVQGCTLAERSTYCESLLQFAMQGRPIQTPGSLAFGQGSVKERIVHLLHYRRLGAGALALCAVAVGVSVTACMVRPQVEAAHAAPEPPAATAETAEPTPTPAPAETPAAMPAATLPTLSDAANSPRFVCPVQYKYISRFMSEDSGHRGDDLHAAEGTEIYAAADGVVLAAQEHYSWGNFVEIDHGTDADGLRWVTLYAHMKSCAVQVGQTVTAGQVIGYVGSTGYATGNACHFEMHVNGTLVEPRYFTAYDGSDAAELTQEKADEILAEAVRNASSDQVTAADGAAALSGVELFTLPVAPPPQVSGYDPENGHPGIDFAAEEGAEVYAVADGIVTTADYDAEKGNYVVLDHGGGLETEYQHLKSSLVSAGQSVVQCQVLGYVGSTGNSTGPHLHFEARQDSAPADLTGTALLAE
ncbi:peptidoglycan DD-metalloendopeptidase family protein [Gemmiger formicilis]|uniref:peptidoglycan DD-metalloendopeptidase family protein n=1 Tax=Gemmiger formicilis TaxID=745368 RepID=UPI003A238C27